MKDETTFAKLRRGEILGSEVLRQDNSVKTSEDAKYIVRHLWIILVILPLALLALYRLLS